MGAVASLDIDASAGSVKELTRMVGRIREQWPDVPIAIRGDSGFHRERIMSWCEANAVDFVLGLARNDRPVGEIEAELAQARCDTIRLKLPKIGAGVRVPARKVWILLAESCPVQPLFMA